MQAQECICTHTCIKNLLAKFSLIMGSILAYPTEAPLLKLFQKCIKKL